MSGAALALRGFSVDVRPREGGASRRIVHGVDLDVPAGSITGVVGESGSGKTLLLRSAVGIAPAAATVHPGDSQLRLGDAGWRLPGGPGPGWAGYVFQDPAEGLDPFRSAGAQVRASLAASGVPRGGRADAADDWLRRVGLPDAAGVGRLHPHELSGGMAQRVGIAVALARRPRLLVADEPTTGLDWTVRRGVVDLLAGLCRDDGLTLVVVSHDLAVVEYLADRICVIQEGRVVERGPRSHFFPGPPEHPYTIELQARSTALREGRLDARRPPRAGADGPGPRGEPVLRACDLGHSYPSRSRGGERVIAVDGVDLALRPGEVVGLVGESGSGKSTLGRLLLHLEAPQRGTVWALGRTLATLPPEALRRLRSRMQMVFQGATAALNPKLTARQHLQETLQIHRPREAPEHPALLADALARFGLAGRGDQRPGQLSGGERRRVGLLRSLLPRPSILVADEPTAGLDAPRKAEVVRSLIAEADKSSAILLISHELDLVRAATGRVLVLLAGRVVQELPAEVLRPDSEPALLHPYTETLVRAGFSGPGPIVVTPRPGSSSAGCPWAARCHRVHPQHETWARCTTERPALVPLGGGAAACHLLPDPRTP